MKPNDPNAVEGRHPEPLSTGKKEEQETFTFDHLPKPDLQYTSEGFDKEDKKDE